MTLLALHRPSSGSQLHISNLKVKHPNTFESCNGTRLGSPRGLNWTVEQVEDVERITLITRGENNRCNAGEVID